MVDWWVVKTRCKYTPNWSKPWDKNFKQRSFWLTFPLAWTLHLGACSTTCCRSQRHCTLGLAVDRFKHNRFPGWKQTDSSTTRRGGTYYRRKPCYTNVFAMEQMQNLHVIVSLIGQMQPPLTSVSFNDWTNVLYRATGIYLASKKGSERWVCHLALYVALEKQPGSFQRNDKLAVWHGRASGINWCGQASTTGTILYSKQFELCFGSGSSNKLWQTDIKGIVQNCFSSHLRVNFTEANLPGKSSSKNPLRNQARILKLNFAKQKQYPLWSTQNESTYVREAELSLPEIKNIPLKHRGHPHIS